MLRYVSHPRLTVPASQEPSVVKLFRSKVKTKSAEHVSSVASRHSRRELNRCMLSVTHRKGPSITSHSPLRYEHGYVLTYKDELQALACAIDSNYE